MIWVYDLATIGISKASIEQIGGEGGYGGYIFFVVAKTHTPSAPIYIHQPSAPAYTYIVKRVKNQISIKYIYFIQSQLTWGRAYWRGRRLKSQWFKTWFSVFQPYLLIIQNYFLKICYSRKVYTSSNLCLIRVFWSFCRSLCLWKL